MLNETKCPGPATQLINPISPPGRAWLSRTDFAGAIQGSGSGHAGHGEMEMVPRAQRRVSLWLLVSRELQTAGPSDPF